MWLNFTIFIYSLKLPRNLLQIFMRFIVKSAYTRTETHSYTNSPTLIAKSQVRWNFPTHTSVSSSLLSFHSLFLLPHHHRVVNWEKFSHSSHISYVRGKQKTNIKNIARRGKWKFIWKWWWHHYFSDTYTYTHWNSHTYTHVEEVKSFFTIGKRMEKSF